MSNAAHLLVFFLLCLCLSFLFSVCLSSSFPSLSASPMTHSLSPFLSLYSIRPSNTCSLCPFLHLPPPGLIFPALFFPPEARWRDLYSILSSYCLILFASAVLKCWKMLYKYTILLYIIIIPAVSFSINTPFPPSQHCLSFPSSFASFPVYC